MKVFPILIAALILLSGCITSGGKKLTGVVPTDHGTWRLQSAIDREKREAAEKKAEEEAALEKKAAEARQKELLEKIKSERVKHPPAKSKPIVPAPQSVEAEDIPIKIAPADSRTPFTPTVTGAKLSPADSLIQDLLNNTESESSIVVIEEEKNKDKPKVKIDWARLIVFYLIAISFVVLVYFGWKTAKTKTREATKEKKPVKRSRKKVSKKQK